MSSQANTAIEGADAISPSQSSRAPKPAGSVEAARARRVSELRKFGLVVGGVFLLIAFRIWWKHHFAEFTPLFYGFAGGGGALFLLGLAVPMVLLPVHFAWMKLAHVLGWLNTRILLAVLFFVAFTTVGVFLRLLRRDPMARSFAGDKSQSYWIDRPEAPVDRERYKKPF